MPSVTEAISAIRAGKMAIVVDAENRENEGDVVMAAEKITPQAVNFMLKHCRGLICVPLEQERIDELELSQMVSQNTDRYQTKFTVSVDSVNTSTGISAFDRAETIKSLIAEEVTPQAFRKPGHIFPIKAEKGGVLKRAGHTEAVVDLAKLAGLKPGGVICEIMDEDGKMATLPQLRKMSQSQGMPIISIADLIAYRLKTDKLVKEEAKASYPTQFGEFTLIAYSNIMSNHIHIALVRGNVRSKENVLVRMHAERFPDDLFGGLRTTNSNPLKNALLRLGKEETSVLVYLRQSEKEGLMRTILRYAAKDKGEESVPMGTAFTQFRDYGVGASILKDLGLSTIKLLTDHPKNMVGLEGYGLKITETISLT